MYVHMHACVCIYTYIYRYIDMYIKNNPSKDKHLEVEWNTPPLLTDPWHKEIARKIKKKQLNKVKLPGL